MKKKSRIPGTACGNQVLSFASFSVLTDRQAHAILVLILRILDHRTGETE